MTQKAERIKLRREKIASITRDAEGGTRGGAHRKRAATRAHQECRSQAAPGYALALDGTDPQIEAILTSQSTVPHSSNGDQRSATSGTKQMAILLISIRTLQMKCAVRGRMTHALSVGPAPGRDRQIQRNGNCGRSTGAIGWRAVVAVHALSLLILPRRKDTLWCLYPMTAMWRYISASTRVAAKPHSGTRQCPCVSLSTHF